MTDFDSLRVKVGRRPIWMLEIDLDFCANVYGTSPCTAAVGTTGTQKCFNTLKSCQDPENYSKTSKTYKFCSDVALMPVGQNLFPCIRDVDIAPTQLDPKGLAVNDSITVTMKDFPHHDRGVDPYVGDRTYTANSQGTFFGKLRARNPFLVNRVMRVQTGYVDANRDVYSQERTYFIDRIEGPDADGNVRLIGKGLLKFADDDKAQVPAQSRGSLNANISNSVASIVLKPAGIGAEYASSGRIRVDDEIIAYTGKSTDTLTGCTRGQHGTAAAAHTADAAVQQCVYYNGSTVPDILYDWLVNYASVPPAYIDKAVWDDEATTWIPTFLADTVLTEPTGVKEMITELLQSCGASMWWDAKTAQLRFKVIVPYRTNGLVPIINETIHILAGSFSVKDLEKERLSRVVIHFDCTNFLKKPEKETCQQTNVSIDASNESADAYGVPVTKEFASRWIFTETVAENVASRILERYGQTPREATFRLDAKDSDKTTGDILDIVSRQIQTIDGSSVSVRFLATQEREVEVGSQHEIVALQIAAQGGGIAYVFTSDSQVDYTLATDNQKAKYFFFSDADGFMSNGDKGAVMV